MRRGGRALIHPGAATVCGVDRRTDIRAGGAVGVLHGCHVPEWDPAPLPTARAPRRTHLPMECPPWYPWPLRSHTYYQRQAWPYTGTAFTRHHQRGASSCLLLRHPLQAMGPVTPTGGAWHARCQGYHQPSHGGTSSGTPVGAVGKGCTLKPKRGRWRVGGGQGGPCGGKALGPSPAEVLLLLLWTLLHPRQPPCSIERGDKAGERGWPHGGGCHHQAPQVSL